MAITRTGNIGLSKVDKDEHLRDWPATQSANADIIDKAVAAKADRSDVPTKVSQLTNDAGYLTSHQSLDAYETKADHDADIRAVDGRLTTVESAIGTGIQQLTTAQIRSIVQSGNAARYFPVGTQLTVPWTYDGKTYDFVWDVVHHYDGSDDAHPLRLMADGTSKPAMCLMAHYCLPIDTQYGPREAAYVAQSDMPAGTYHFAIKITVKWASAPGIAGTVGTRQYQFTTTKAHPAGAQFVWEQGESAQIASAKVYDEPMGTDISETVTITETEAPEGTDLGTMSENSSDAGLNNPQRTIYGSNNWARSSLRLFLNDTSDAFADQLVTPWHRKAAYDGKAGVLGGFSEDFRAVLGEVTNFTQPHPFDGNDAEETHDTLYLASAREHGFSNYLSNTADGYVKEGVPWDYWTQLAKANGISDGTWKGWQTYPALITYDLANHTQARHCWERSAYRSVTGALAAGYVGASGTVSGYSSASAGFRAVLSACIV